MLRQIKFTTGFFILLFLASCGGGDDKKKTDNVTPETTSQPITEVLTTGSLDTLYIERQAFDTINNGSRLVFSFTFKAADTLTMHGWLLKPGNKYDSLPNIKLKNTKPSGINYSVGIYFGNVVLSPNEFNKIKTALVPGMNFILFAPVLIGNNVGYKIFVSDKIRDSKEAILVVTPTGAEANPSPPKVN